jgi:hypothetical protein
VRVALRSAVGQDQLRGRDALFREELRCLVGRVLRGDRGRDLPEDQVAEHPAVVVCRVRRRLGDHPAACPVLARDGQGEVGDGLHVHARVSTGRADVGRAGRDVEGEQPQVAGYVQFLDEPAGLLPVVNVGAGQALHQEHAVDALQATAVIGLLLPAVNAPQDVDVVPPVGHDSSPRSATDHALA